MSLEIYVPGQGVTSLEGRTIDRWVNQYDERLSFKRNPVTGDFCLYIKMPNGSDPPELPVVGFGPEQPSLDAVQRKVYESDTMRHGELMLKRMNAHNEQLKKDNSRAYEDASWDSAERIEQAMRAHGLSPVIKSLRPRVRG